jgi:hypothetical protein
MEVLQTSALPLGYVADTEKPLLQQAFFLAVEFVDNVVSQLTPNSTLFNNPNGT